MAAKFTITGVVDALMGRTVRVAANGGIYVDGDLTGNTGGTAERPVVAELRVISGQLESVECETMATAQPGVTVGQLRAGMHATVHGPVQGDVRAGMKVSCGAVAGNVDGQMGVDVAGNVGGRVDAGMSVTVRGDVTGGIDAGMSVKIGGTRK